MYVLSNFEARWHNYCCLKNALIIKYYACFSVDLVIQHAMCMHRIILPTVACLVLIQFQNYLLDNKIFRKKDHEMGTEALSQA
jgi:hypothetical protein